MTVEEKLVRDFGLTDNVELAGYLLPNGDLVNLSYMGYMRDEDHRIVGQYFKKRSGTDALNEMMRRGAVRVMCSKSHYGFEYIKKPTDKQKAIMRKTYYLAMKLGRFFNIDVSNNTGKIIHCYNELND